MIGRPKWICQYKKGGPSFLAFSRESQAAFVIKKPAGRRIAAAKKRNKKISLRSIAYV
jgi:hypothetical protein